MSYLRLDERLAELIMETDGTVKQASVSIPMNIDNLYHWMSRYYTYLPSLRNLLKLADYYNC